MTWKSTVIATLLVAGSAGCTGETVNEPGPAEALGPGLSPEGTSLNGTSLNGTSLNGTSLNGTSLNGTSLNGTSLNGTSLNGTTLGGVTLVSTVFHGTRSDETPISGSDFVGSIWTGQLSNGSTLALRIDSMQGLTDANADVNAYGVSYQTGDGWAPLCGTDGSAGPILAIPLSGVWSYQSGVPGGGGFTPDPARFTFACRKTAIAKCVELGYKPWKTLPSGASLQAHQVACTRLLRADYCGNGTPYTVTGTLLELYDDVGIQGDTEPWEIEAEWTAAGARCEAVGLSQRFLKTFGSIPSCVLSKISLDCGAASHFDTGTLLMDEHQPEIGLPLGL